MRSTQIGKSLNSAIELGTGLNSPPLLSDAPRFRIFGTSESLRLSTIKTRGWQNQIILYVMKSRNEIISQNFKLNMKTTKATLKENGE